MRSQFIQSLAVVVPVLATAGCASFPFYGSTESTATATTASPASAPSARLSSTRQKPVTAAVSDEAKPRQAKPKPRRQKLTKAEKQAIYVRCFKSAYKKRGFGEQMDKEYMKCLKRYGFKRRLPTG
ncbi:MAG: hypothetical protein AAF732_13305 [Pseudomonadota bacterium]